MVSYHLDPLQSKALPQLHLEFQDLDTVMLREQHNISTSAYPDIQGGICCGCAAMSFFKVEFVNLGGDVGEV